MLRILLTSCTLAGLFVAQWAALPHGHAGADVPRDQHAATPHVHLSDADDGHHGQAQSRHGSPEGLAAVSTGGGVTAESANDHDEDAVFLPSAGGWTFVTLAGGSALAPLNDIAACASTEFAAAAIGQVGCAVEFVQTGEFLSGREICLALRTLRI